MTEFQAGRVLAQRYKLIAELGRGGMGSVWRAEHLMLGSEVAVKLIDPQIAQHAEAQARFVREARAAAALRSPHVVQILDYGVDEVPFIVMELMVGESLSDRLERVKRLSPEETARIMTDVARALSKAHEAGIIHRDLKPDNVFLVENDDAEVAKVLDFGVARMTDYSTNSAGMTSTGAVLGTPYYMSPEQAEGLKDIDHRCDIWAMAVMTYECLLGVRPFTGESLGGVFLAICAREIPVPSAEGPVPAGFDEWFQQGTSRILSERFGSVRDAARRLQELCGGRGAGRGSSLEIEDEVVAVGVADKSSGGRGDSSAERVGSRSSMTVPGLASTTIEGLPRRRSPWGWVAMAGALGVGGVVWASQVLVSPDDGADPDAPAAFVAAPAEDETLAPEAETFEPPAPKPELRVDPAVEASPLPSAAPAPVPKKTSLSARSSPSGPRPLVRKAPAPQPVVAPAPAVAPKPTPAPERAKPRPVAPSASPRPAPIDLGI